MSAQAPILLVCENFPPVRGIGGRRWAKFAKELARRGHAVHVIRSTGIRGRLDSFWSADVQAPGIVHHPVALRYPSVLTRRPLTTLGERFRYNCWLRLLPLLTRGNFYDSTVFCRRRVLRLGEQLIRQHGIRHIVVTGAPFRLMAYAATWKEQFPDVHLVLDFRDEWTWGRHYGLTTLSPRRQEFERQLEARAIQHADQVISPSRTILDHLSSTYGAMIRAATWIPHPIDPDDLPGESAETRDGGFRMAYAGSLYDQAAALRYFEAVVEAFARLKKQDPRRFAETRFDLYITGHGTDPLERMVREHGLAGHIRFHAPEAPKAILRKLAGADLLPLFLPPEKKDIMVTKLHEWFALGRPVLHIGEPGLVGETIRGQELGATIRLEELATELPRIISGERKINVASRLDLDELMLSRVVDHLAAEVFP